MIRCIIRSNDVWSDLYGNDTMTMQTIEGIQMGALHVNYSEIGHQLPKTE